MQKTIQCKSLSLFSKSIFHELLFTMMELQEDNGEDCIRVFCYIRVLFLARFLTMYCFAGCQRADCLVSIEENEAP